MSRHERRRKQRAGKQQKPWDLYFAAVVAVVVLGIFTSMFLFPNLNIADYGAAPQRVLGRIVNRGIGWLENDQAAIEAYTYSRFIEDEEWASYLVERQDGGLRFTELEEMTVLEVPAGQALPAEYASLESVVAGLREATRNREFQLEFQQRASLYNVVSLIRRTGSGDDAELEQYIMVFDAAHRIENLIYHSSAGDDAVGHSFSNLYTPVSLEDFQNDADGE